MTSSKYAQPRSGTHWAVASPELEPPALADKTLYVSFRNVSDGDIDLREIMERSARDQGWTLLRDPNAAKFRLRATLRSYGEVAPESAGRQAAGTMGWIGGAAVGAGSGAVVSTFTGGRSAGVAAGIGVGMVATSLMQVGLSNGSTPREWAMIVDFVLEEFVGKPVEFDLTTDQDSVRDGRSAIANTSYATATRVSHYYPHGMRLSVWANQMNMQSDEALPHILEKAEKVMGQMLPQ
jgi:hypothetical protein